MHFGKSKRNIFGLNYPATIKLFFPHVRDSSSKGNSVHQCEADAHSPVRQVWFLNYVKIYSSAFQLSSACPSAVGGIYTKTVLQKISSNKFLLL